MPNLRLCRETDSEPERDELAPLPFCAPARPGEDAIEHAESALERADAKLSELNALIDEDIDESIEPDDAEALRFALWTDPDDDGPWAA